MKGIDYVDLYVLLTTNGNQKKSGGCFFDVGKEGTNDRDTFGNDNEDLRSRCGRLLRRWLCWLC